MRETQGVKAAQAFVAADSIKTIRDALDGMGVALADHDHHWSPELREAFDKADRLLTTIEKWLALEPS